MLKHNHDLHTPAARLLEAAGGDYAAAEAALSQVHDAGSECPYCGTDFYEAADTSMMCTSHRRWWDQCPPAAPEPASI